MNFSTKNIIKYFRCTTSPTSRLVSDFASSWSRHSLMRTLLHHRRPKRLHRPSIRRRRCRRSSWRRSSSTPLRSASLSRTSRTCSLPRHRQVSVFLILHKRQVFIKKKNISIVINWFCSCKINLTLLKANIALYPAETGKPLAWVTFKPTIAQSH